MEVHTAEPLLPGPNHREFEIYIAKLKKPKSAGSDQTLAELILTDGETLMSEVHKPITSIWIRKTCLISGKSP
jgi:hypothetical protein